MNKATNNGPVRRGFSYSYRVSNGNGSSEPLFIFVIFSLLLNLVLALAPNGLAQAQALTDPTLAASTASSQVGSTQTGPANREAQVGSLSNAAATTLVTSQSVRAALLLAGSTCPTQTNSGPLTPTLTYLGTGGSASWGSPLKLAALLTDQADLPLTPAATVLTFTLSPGSSTANPVVTATATTDANGLARTTTLTPTNPALLPGPVTVGVSWPGSAGGGGTTPTYAAIQTSQTLTLTKQPTSLIYLSALPGLTAPAQPVSARLLDSFSGQGIAGVNLSFSLGTAPLVTATTDATGTASTVLTFSPDQTVGQPALVVNWAGDLYRQAAQLSVPTSLYADSAFGTVVVRHAPNLPSNARINGSIRQLTGEYVTLNTGAVVTGDLLVPGSPTVQRNGSGISFGGIVTGTGTTTPTGYSVSLNDNTTLGRLLIRTNPVTLSNVPNPPTPTGSRSVSINSASDTIGNPATLLNLTLNTNAGAVAVPGGTYGTFSANTGSTLVLGITGTLQPVVYNLQGLSFNGTGGVQVVGPIVLNVKTGFSFSGSLGSSAHPIWLETNVADGSGLTLNTGATYYGVARSPAGAVTLNGGTTLQGAVFADRLTFNSGSVATIQGLTIPTSTTPGPALAASLGPVTPLSGGGLIALPGAGNNGSGVINWQLTLTNTTATGGPAAVATNIGVASSFLNTLPQTRTNSPADLSAGGTTSSLLLAESLAVFTTTRQTSGGSGGSGESSPAYQTRLGAVDGLLLGANSLLTWADSNAQSYVPLDVVGQPRPTEGLPLLTLGLAATSPAGSCASPGQPLTYTVRVANLGTAPAQSGTVTLTYPDSTTGTLGFGPLGSGSVASGNLVWNVPTSYTATTTVLTTTGRVVWQDGATPTPNSYGPVGAQLLTPLGTSGGGGGGSNGGVPGLFFQASVGGAQAGRPFDSQPVVVKLLADGTVDTAFTGLVTLTLKSGTGTGGAVLAGPTVVNAVGGIASFGGLSINLVGTGYVVTAQAAPAAGVGPVDSPAFNVVGSKGGATTIIARSGGGQTTTTGTAFTSPLQAQVLDGNGGPTPNATVTFQIVAGGPTGSGGTGPGASATFPGGVTSVTAQTNATGIATSPALTANTTGGTFVVKATTPGVAAGVNFVLNNTQPSAQSRGVTITLNPVVSGPNPVSSTVVLTATVARNDVTQLSGQTVTFLVVDAATGNSITTTTRVTAADGTASFSYSSFVTATHLVTATISVSGTSISSNLTTVSWFLPKSSVSTTLIYGSFFHSNNDTSFVANPGVTPLFTQTFPSLNFLPSYHDFNPVMDYPYDVNGNAQPPIPVQGNGYQLGQNTGLRGTYQDVFTSSLVVKSAGNVTLTIFADDGYIFGIGGGALCGTATCPDPYQNNPTGITTTPFLHLPVVSIDNAPVSGSYTFQVYFPAPGIYPYELDHFAYNVCDGGGCYFEGLTLSASGNNTSLPPAGSIAISPTIFNSPVNVNQPITFTVVVSDANGTPISNQPVNLQVNGVNFQVLSANTNSSGQATFVYTETLAGLDTFQAFSSPRGSVTFSPQVSVVYTGANNSGNGAYPSNCNYPLTTTTWLSNPANRSTVSSQTSLVAAIPLGSGTVIDFWPASNIQARQTLLTTSSPIGAGQTIANFDPTILADGSYILRVCGTDGNGNKAASLTLISATGENKPGRVTFSLTDLTVPVAGLPVVVGRTYDSLDRNRAGGDFGPGWSLSVGNPKLEVNPAGDVTLTTLDGKRSTFYFTPGSSFFGFGAPGYTPEPGLYGSLTTDGCGAVASAGGAGGYACFPGGRYQDSISTYFYRDPYGRTYGIRASDGKLRSLKDLQDNTLFFNDDGIAATGGAKGTCKAGDPTYIVCFQRDSANSNRITAITDPMGNVYRYGYATTDGPTQTTGDLVSVSLPSLATPVLYTYYTGGLAHFFASATDPRGNTAVTTSYYTDAANNGRLKSVAQPVTDPTSGTSTVYTTNYAYDVPNNLTFVTNPDGGQSAQQTDAYGKVISQTDALGRTTSMIYDARHQLSQTNLPSPTTGRADSPDSRVMTATYSDKGYQTGTGDPLGHTTSTTYTPYGGPQTITDQVGHTYNVGYGQVNNPFSTAYELPTVVTDTVNGQPAQVGGYDFDDRGSVLARYDGKGGSTRFTYDSQGNKATETDALGHTTSYHYDLLGRMDVMTDANGIASTYQYDPLGRLTTATMASNTARSMTTITHYDANGNKTDETDALSHTTYWGYDTANRLTIITYSNATVVKYAYDWRGNKTSETDQSGRQTVMGYDLAGQTVSSTVAANKPEVGASTVISYDLAGRKVRDYNPYTATLGSLPANQPYVGYEYDAASRLLTTTDQAGKKTGYVYDNAGRKISETDALGHTTGYHYDERGRLDKTTYPALPNGTFISTSQAYDPAGNVTSRTDGNGLVTGYSYDTLNRLTAVTNPMSQPTAYTYDALGRLSSILDANRHTTGMGYDELGRQTSKVWPDGSTERYGYDTVGNRTSQALSDGVVTNTFSYDNLNRLRQANYASAGTGTLARTVVYTYTATGQRQSVNDTAYGTTSYQYDNRDRVTLIQQPAIGSIAAQSVGYGYDERSNRTVMTTTAPSASLVAATSYGYDAVGRLQSVLGPNDGGTATTYSYLDNGLRNQQTLPNGIISQYSYDPLNRLTAITQGKSAGPTLAQYAYGLDGAGNRTAITETTNYTGTSQTRQMNYGYDPAYRLTTEKDTLQAGITTTYGYDAVGNRLGLTVTNGITNSVTNSNYNELDQLIGSVGPVVSSNYNYVRGNLVGVTTNGATTAYTWDSADRLVGVALPGSVNLSYSYDADGRRVTQRGTGTGTANNNVNYLWDELSQYGDVVLESDSSSGAAKTSYVLGDGELLSQKRAGVSAADYFLKDGQGSTRSLVDNIGNIANSESYIYDAFGSRKNSPDTSATNYLYNGQQYDPLTKFYALRARYYNTNNGRFLSFDPFNGHIENPDTLHKFSYVANNPINKIDPSGMEIVSLGLQLQKVSANVKMIAAAAAVTCGVLATSSLLSGLFGGNLLDVSSAMGVVGTVCVQKTFVADSNLFMNRNQTIYNDLLLTNPRVTLAIPTAALLEVLQGVVRSPLQTTARLVGLPPFTGALRIIVLSASIPNGINPQGNLSLADAQILETALQRNQPLVTNNSAMRNQVTSNPAYARWRSVEIITPFQALRRVMGFG